MPSIRELKQKRQAALQRASEICDEVSHAGRDFTPKEREEVKTLVAKARELKADIDRLEGGDSLRQQLDQLGALFGTKSATADPRFRKPGSKWSDDWFRAREGAKELLPASTTVTVGSLSGTIGTVSDDDRLFTILQVIPVIPHQGDNFTYLRETVRNHQARPVAYGARKPESDYQLEKVVDNIRTIAHLSSPIPRQFLSDAPLLEQYLNGALRDGLIREVENQIINGNGTDENFTGILNQAGVQVQAFDTDMVTTIRKAITKLETLPVMPDAVVMHPADWEAIELTHESGAGYVMGAPGVLPVDRARRRLWGLPVAATTGIAEGTAVVGAFRSATALLETEGVRIDSSEAFLMPEGTEGYEASGTGFQHNMVQFRAEGRWGLAIGRPAALVEVDLTGGS